MSYGYIEIVCGSMFSGKTGEMIRRMRLVKIAEQSYLVFKPKIDDRYARDHVSSHNGDNFPAIEVDSSMEIIDIVGELFFDVVSIDEAQFFDSNIVMVVRELAKRGIRVIIAGLDTDFRYEPFGSMPELLAIANEVQKLKAICSVCKKHRADRTQRIVDGQPAYYEDDIILVGAEDSYEPRCPDHHRVPRKESIVVSSP